MSPETHTFVSTTTRRPSPRPHSPHLLKCPFDLVLDLLGGDVQAPSLSLPASEERAESPFPLVLTNHLDPLGLEPRVHGFSNQGRDWDSSLLS